jgi:hypothetical protein
MRVSKTEYENTLLKSTNSHFIEGDRKKDFPQAGIDQ